MSSLKSESCRAYSFDVAERVRTQSLRAIHKEESNSESLVDTFNSSRLKSFSSDVQEESILSSERFNKQFENVVSSRGILEEEVQADVESFRDRFEQLSKHVDESNPIEANLLDLSEDLLRLIVQIGLSTERKMNEGFCVESIMRRSIAELSTKLHQSTEEKERLGAQNSMLKEKFKVAVDLLNELPCRRRGLLREGAGGASPTSTPSPIHYQKLSGTTSKPEDPFKLAYT